MIRVLSIAVGCAALAGLHACGPQPGKLVAEVSPASARPEAAATPYPGRWTVGEAACGTSAWEVRADGLSAPDGRTCEFLSVETTLAGYAVRAICTTPAGRRPGHLLLTVVDDDAITVSGGPFVGPAALRRCAAGAP